MKIRLNNPTLLDDLIDFLRRAECLAEQAGTDTIDVEVCSPLIGEAARVELGFYLGVWCSIHPGVQVERVS